MSTTGTVSVSGVAFGDPSFGDWPLVSQVVADDSLYADIVNHCQNYASYMVPGSKITSAHECTHGVNSDIRNAAGGRVNGFYLGYGRSIVVPEPKCRKSDAVKYIPASLQGNRYSLYVTGQREWDAKPLYLFDEFVAYINGVYAAIDLKVRQNYVETNLPASPLPSFLIVDDKPIPRVQGSRIIDGPIEFVSYATAVLMAAGTLDDTLATFSKWLLGYAYDSYFKAKPLFQEFIEQEHLYHTQATGDDWKNQRQFLKDKLGFEVPTGVAPEPDPKPLDWHF